MSARSEWCRLGSAELGSCASSGRAWRLRAARHSREVAGPLGAKPLPRVFERAASKAANVTACEHPGMSTIRTRAMSACRCGARARQHAQSAALAPCQHPRSLAPAPASSRPLHGLLATSPRPPQGLSTASPRPPQGAVAPLRDAALPEGGGGGGAMGGMGGGVGGRGGMGGRPVGARQGSDSPPWAAEPWAAAELSTHGSGRPPAYARRRTRQHGRTSRKRPAHGAWAWALQGAAPSRLLTAALRLAGQTEPHGRMEPAVQPESPS